MPERIEQVLAAWEETVPARWRRGEDRDLWRSERGDVRCRRRHRHCVPRTGSEHELEQQVLGPDPARIATRCFGEQLVDGINAVPLSLATRGGGKVEADMLLLTHGADGHRLWLVEAKTTSNNSWFAVVESLRQLKLFRCNPIARQVLLKRRGLGAAQPPVTAVVLGTPSFYTATGAKAAMVAPAQELINAMSSRHKLDVRLAVWDRTSRLIEPITSLHQKPHTPVAEMDSFLGLVNRIRAAALLEPVPCLAPPMPLPLEEGRRLITSWLAETLGGQTTLESDGVNYRPPPRTDRRKLAGTLPGAEIGAAQFVALPTVFSTLIAAWPDWAVTDLNGVLLGWHYPVPVRGSTDAWGWQAVTERINDQS
ncbi:MAG: hypothetical protein ACLP22_17680 [Solirubrobacteraceae bacterium]